MVSSFCACVVAIWEIVLIYAVVFQAITRLLFALVIIINHRFFWKNPFHTVLKHVLIVVHTAESK